MDIEARTMRHVTRRLLPLLIVCYFVAFLDRVNIGFASLTMNKDIGISATVYGQAAGVFFLSYFLLEVPSNLALERFGARKWIARIMITWGLISGCMAFVQGEWSLLAMRFLLGAAEAGFFPGVIFYLTLWFPAAYRGRVIGYFMAGIPLSGVIGAPMSSYLLELNGVMGLHGWQWMFIAEAVPAVLLSGAVLVLLTDRPALATWLPPDEREWLRNEMREEARTRGATAHSSLVQTLLSPLVLLLSLINFCNDVGLYGFSFFLPQLVKQFGWTTIQVGWISVIPFLMGGIGCVLFGWSSDARSERKNHLLVAQAIGIAGMVAFTLMPTPLTKMAALSVAAFGIYASVPLFWTLPPSLLSVTAAASGIAAINALGNVAGYYAPSGIGYLKDVTGGFDAGMQLVAGIVGLAFLIVLVAVRIPPIRQAGSASSLAKAEAEDVPAE